MSKLKDNGVQVIDSWDAWDDRISDTVEFHNGSIVRQFKVWSISSGEQAEIATEMKKGLPAQPKRRKGRDGSFDANDPEYDRLMEKWEKEAEPAAKLATMRWIEFGWAKPNGITIPGNTDQEKLTNLKNKVAGDIYKLRDKIEIMSNLNEENIDFLSLSSSL